MRRWSRKKDGIEDKDENLKKDKIFFLLLLVFQLRGYICPSISVWASLSFPLALSLLVPAVGNNSGQTLCCNLLPPSLSYTPLPPSLFCTVLPPPPSWSQYTGSRSKLLALVHPPLPLGAQGHPLLAWARNHLRVGIKGREMRDVR